MGTPNVKRTSVLEFNYLAERGEIKTVCFDIAALAEVINSDEMLVADKVRYLFANFSERFDTAFFEINRVINFSASHESPNIDTLNQSMSGILNARKIMQTVNSLCKQNALIFAANKSDPRNSLWKNLADSAAHNASICKEAYDMVKKVLTVSYTNFN